MHIIILTRFGGLNICLINGQLHRYEKSSTNLLHPFLMDSSLTFYLRFHSTIKNLDISKNNSSKQTNKQTNKTPLWVLCLQLPCIIYSIAMNKIDLDLDCTLSDFNTETERGVFVNLKYNLRVFPSFKSCWCQ